MSEASVLSTALGASMDEISAGVLDIPLTCEAGTDIISSPKAFWQNALVRYWGRQPLQKSSWQVQASH